MAGFHDIIGHNQIIEHLQNAILLNKVSHAYIFDGECGAGKKLLARTFAMTLQCERMEENPCGECRSCKQAMHNNHPDIIWVTHEKPNSIGVKDIREQINNDIIIKPYSGKYKIYIIDEADKLTIQSQNALLKTIEEPPAYAVILLLTTNAEGLLPTVLSRCITIPLRAVDDVEMKQFLMQKLQLPDYQADICVAFAQGNVGKAIRISSSEEFNELREDTLLLLKNIDNMEIYEMIDFVKKIAENKKNIYDYLDIMMIWFRDVLLFKATSDANDLVFKDNITFITKQANMSSYNGLELVIEAIEKAKARLNANVNFELVMELLLLTIKEN